MRDQLLVSKTERLAVLADSVERRLIPAQSIVYPGSGGETPKSIPSCITGTTIETRLVLSFP